MRFARLLASIAAACCTLASPSRAQLGGLVPGARIRVRPSPDSDRVDGTIIAEAPKIMPHARQMRANIADALGIDIGCVSVKATTNERMGFVGREEGIAAIAIAAVETDRPNG